MSEQAFPEGGEQFETGEQTIEDADCDGKVQCADRGNRDYAWWYLINGSDKTATVTIRRSWLYNGERRSDTQQHVLYAREEREAFSFPRNQDPRIQPIACSLS